MSLTALLFAQNSASGYGQNRNGQLGGGQGLAPNGLNFVSADQNRNSVFAGTTPGLFGGGPGGFSAGRGAGGGGSYAAKRSEPSGPHHIEDESIQGLWNEKTAILTPGDKYEIKLKVEAGETLFAGATSDAFDPGLDVIDSKGKVLAKNDDRVDGDQAPFLIYRFKDAGDYSLRVLSYRSVAGGQFTVKTRRFIATDIAVGTTKAKLSHPITVSQQSELVFRLSPKKGDIYDLRSFTASFKGTRGGVSSWGMGFIGIIGPTGVAESDWEKVDTQESAPVYQFKSDGDYYVEFQLNGPREQLASSDVQTEVRAVSTVSVKSSDVQTLSFEPYELKLIEMQVKPEQIVRTALDGDYFTVKMSTPKGLKVDDQTIMANGNDAGPGQPYGSADAWSWYRINVDKDKEFLRVFHGAGTVRFAIRCPFYRAEKVTIRNTDSLPDWSDGAALNQSLDIGDSQYFLLKSTKSELMRVRAKASHFLPRLDIFRLSGELANSLMNRQTHVAGDDLYFPDEGTFIVRLSCEGNGGSGDFVMNRDELKPTPVDLGSVQVLKLDGSNFGLYSVNLEAGKRYELLLDAAGRGLQVDLIDDDGQFLNSQVIGFDSVLVHYFVPLKSGKHRLWLRGGQGTYKYQLSLHKAPTIGG